ncbi:uncharacterized protein LOC112603189 [Melanaphis sacchari]|uniref:uncharacterized protein LOC112603189 n=1 Tax=Melanaphis sacchari TaxID=742174 RepID=UPI000DC15661|nr:uncharacterized protein LOC112603189 [Melanaphis sacchari]
MTTITSIAALFSCILLHLFVFTSTAAVMPDSDLPFEFNHDTGSVITEDNVLTQSVSSDGETVFKANEPQPIIKYQNSNKNTNNLSTNQKKNGNYKTMNSEIEYEIPIEHTSSSHFNFPNIMKNQWKFLERMNRLIPGFNNVRVVYV